MTYEFSKSEINEVYHKFPKLKLTQKGVWEGTIDFDRTYRDYRIIDNYQIRIIIPDNYPDSIPFVQEIGGKAKAIAEKYNIKDPRDFHWNPGNGTACLCVKQQEKIKFPPGSTLVSFIENLVISYFYGLSYFKDHKKWPWREYSHGGLGILEYYAENPVEQTKDTLETLSVVFRDDVNWKKYRKHIKNPTNNKSCICGSKEPFAQCHSLAWQGLMRLHDDIHRLKLNAYKLFSK